MIMKETMIDAYRWFQEDLERTLPKKSENPYQDALLLITSLIGLLIIGIVLGTVIFFAIGVVISGSSAVVTIKTSHAYLILVMLICMAVVTFFEVRNK